TFSLFLRVAGCEPGQSSPARGDFRIDGKTRALARQAGPGSHLPAVAHPLEITAIVVGGEVAQLFTRHPPFGVAQLQHASHDTLPCNGISSAHVGNGSKRIRTGSSILGWATPDGEAA